MLDLSAVHLVGGNPQGGDEPSQSTALLSISGSAGCTRTPCEDALMTAFGVQLRWQGVNAVSGAARFTQEHVLVLVELEVAQTPPATGHGQRHAAQRAA